MSILSWFRNPFRPIASVDHPEIGEAIAINRLEGGDLYWESKEQIQVGSHSLLLVFVAPETGPNEAQLAYWRNVIGALPELEEKGRQAIARETGNRIQEDELSGFVPTLIALPEANSQKPFWSMSFESDQHEDLITVEYDGGDPSRVEMN